MQLFTISLEQLFSYDPIIVIAIAAGFIVFLTIAVLVSKPEHDFGKAFFFLLFIISIVGVTAYVAGNTLYKVSISPTKGPVHWHADFRIFKCGIEIDLLDPSGLSNRIGTPILHEHGDKRIHIEGLISSLEEVSLANFFKVIGGELDISKFIVPTNMGSISMQNGESCPYGNGVEKADVLQVFLWETEDGTATQRKLDNFPAYVLKPEALVPPGDCLIFEFGDSKARTERLCEQYEVAVLRGDLNIQR